MAKVTSLTAHRNNLPRRKAKQLRREILDCAHWPASGFSAPLAGYAVVLWSTEAEATAFWNGTEDLGPVMVEDHVNTILKRKIAMRDAARALGRESED